MKKLLCLLLAAGLVGCSSSSSGEKTTVKKDADYYANLIEEEKVEPAYEGVYISGDYEGMTMAYEFSTGDSNDLMFGIGDDNAMYIIEDSLYLLVDGEWYYLDAGDELSSLADSLDLDGMKDDILSMFDLASEDAQITSVENGSDSNMVYITNDDNELVYEFDVNTDKVISITKEEDDNKATIGFTDDDWQSTVLKATEDVEPSDISDFYNALQDFYSEMY